LIILGDMPGCYFSKRKKCQGIFMCKTNKNNSENIVKISILSMKRRVYNKI